MNEYLEVEEYLDKHRQLLLLQSDVKILEDTATSDFKSKIWGSWPRLVNELNSLNQEAKELGIDTGIDPIEHVPEGRLAHLAGVGAGVPDEKAKVSEIISTAQKLFRRIDIEVDQKPDSDIHPDPMLAIHQICGRFHSVAALSGGGCCFSGHRRAG